MDGNTTIVTIAADLEASRGILVVSSARNEGASSISIPNTIIAPSDGDSVLAVGSVTADGMRSPFSSMGPSASGKIKPDVMARGSSTVCASPSDQHGYLEVSGTSLSCPLVAGAAALVWQANPTLTNIQVLELLKNTADNADSPDNSYGWGSINAYRAAMYYLDSTEITENKGNGMEDFTLLVNYPNPFNSSIKISYHLFEAGEISIIILNNIGQQMDILYSGYQNAGLHDLSWETFEMASGIYYIVLRTQNNILTQKALSLK
jgi:serine protease AprX